jgi:hypothetical protein
VHLWTRQDLRDGAAAWKINREHPAVSALLASADSSADTERILRILEDGLPLHDIHLHISNDLPVAEGTATTDDDLETIAARLVAALHDKPEMIERLLQQLPVIEPFSRDPDKARIIAERLRQ